MVEKAAEERDRLTFVAVRIFSGYQSRLAGSLPTCTSSSAVFGWLLSDIDLTFIVSMIGVAVGNSCRFSLVVYEKIKFMLWWSVMCPSHWLLKSILIPSFRFSFSSLGLQPIDPSISSLRWVMMRLGGSFSFLQQEFTIRFGSTSAYSVLRRMNLDFSGVNMCLMVPKLHLRSPIKLGL
ncbi:hypothetical protein CARUB_v10025261mg [Capsella rubella]|uniref:Uncharacterized protein n=1 Tax=Capsella rubella TaxID=81985 RepID=R0HY85_9BRAS|nr:hypothetical protein CARUB_v10025261mg [Capsella rubella]